MGTGLEDTADFMKWEVSGAEDARDQAEFEIWVWMFSIPCFYMLYSCFFFFFFAFLLDCTKLDPIPAETGLKCYRGAY